MKYKVGQVVLTGRDNKEYLVQIIKITKLHIVARILKSGQVWDFETKEIIGFPK